MSVKTKELSVALAELAGSSNPAKVLGLDAANKPVSTTISDLATVAGGLKAEYLTVGKSILLKVAEFKADTVGTIRVQNLGYGNAYDEFYIGIRTVFPEGIYQYKLYGNSPLKFYKSENNTALYLKTGDWNILKFRVLSGKINFILEPSDVDVSTLVEVV